MNKFLSILKNALLAGMACTGLGTGIGLIAKLLHGEHAHQIFPFWLVGAVLGCV